MVASTKALDRFSSACSFAFLSLLDALQLVSTFCSLRSSTRFALDIMMSLSFSSASEREGNLLVDNLIPKLSILIYANTCLVNHLTHIIHRFSHVCLPLGMNGLYGIWCVQLVGVTIFPSAGRKQVHPFVERPLAYLVSPTLCSLADSGLRLRPSSWWP